MKPRTIASVGLAALMTASLAACNANTSSTTGGESGADGVTINYWLWDDRQAPLYQQCADDFHAANPGITVKITQTAWGQYWETLTTQLAAGNAPDVFTNHSAHLLQFIDNNQIMDLTEMAQKASTTPSTSPAWPTCPSTTASATACPRTGTRRASCTTPPWPPRPGTRRRTWRN